MKDNQPLVSVGIPVYNGEKYLKEMLDSLIKQTYSNIEIIISDNASTDRTPEILVKYSTHDSRIKITKQKENIGVYLNTKFVIKQCNGKYYLPSAHDDRWDVTFIEKAVMLLEENEKAIMCLPMIEFINEDGDTLDRSNYEKKDNADLSGHLKQRIYQIFIKQFWGEYYGLIRTDCIKEIEIKNIYGSDVILTLELCFLGPFVKINEKLFYYRLFENKCYTGSQILERFDFDSLQFHPTAFLLLTFIKTIFAQNISFYKKMDIYLHLVYLVYSGKTSWHLWLKEENSIIEIIKILVKNMKLLDICFITPFLLKQLRFHR